MRSRLFVIPLVAALASCASTENTSTTVTQTNSNQQVEEKDQTNNVENSHAAPDAYFIFGTPGSNIYDIKLSLGRFDLENYTFVEDPLSPLAYQSTDDNRYLVGKAKVGSVIAITKTEAKDASGTSLGVFTPCNQTLVFKLPLNPTAVYITDVNYQWENISITPTYSDKLDAARVAFDDEYLQQGKYIQLDAELYNDCETQIASPTIMMRPF